MNPKVDEFLRNTDKWQKEMEQLRHIVLDCGLMEELKWKQPCYSFNNSNVLIISGFKDHCVLSFIKGVLLQDADKILVSPGENSHSVRFLKFTDIKQIVNLEATIKAYIFEAIEVEKAGLKVERKDNTNLDLVKELESRLNEDPVLKQAFIALTPGRQRAYNMFFEGAKQSKTRYDRIEKYRPRIMAGKGMNDCICGKSKRMPNCDGSHKYN